jgi:hypothetical protein
MMNKSDPLWKQFEQIVANIQRQLAPGAIIDDNVKIMGKSGHKRQFDVIAVQKIGLVEITIAFECKRYSRPVTIDKVEAFVGRLHDAGLPVGVMISERGFDSGAVDVAAKENILLFTCREAEQADWNNLFGENAWLNFIMIGCSIPSAKVKWALDTAWGSPSLQSTIWGWNPETNSPVDLGGFGELIMEDVKELPVRIGTHTVVVDPVQPLSFVIANVHRSIASIDVDVIIRATVYPVSLRIGEGRILRRVGNIAGYIELASEGFDWRKVMETVRGTDLTQEEYDHLKDAAASTISLGNPDRIQQYIRLVATQITP